MSGTPSCTPLRHQLVQPSTRKRGREGGCEGGKGGGLVGGRERGREAQGRSGERHAEREGERQGGRQRGREVCRWREGGRRRRETSSCRFFFAPASISAFTASVAPSLTAAIRAVTPRCPPQEEREGHPPQALPSAHSISRPPTPHTPYPPCSVHSWVDIGCAIDVRMTVR